MSEDDLIEDIGEEEEEEAEEELSWEDRDFIKDLSRAQIVIFLEEKRGIMCRDDESTGLLRETLISDITESDATMEDVRNCMSEIEEAEQNIADKLSSFELACIKAGLV